MSQLSLYERVVGSPLFYERIRPLIVGGIDMSPVYERLQTDNESIVVDIGCGTGDALRHLTRFASYSGFDVDDAAVSFAASKYQDSRIGFHCRPATASDIESLSPSHVVLAGLLHHLSDEEASGLLHMLKGIGGPHRVVTQDIVFLQDSPLSNFLARRDRGRHCRQQREYEALAKSSGFHILSSEVIRSRPRTGLAKYLVMTLVPSRYHEAGQSDREAD